MLGENLAVLLFVNIAHVNTCILYNKLPKSRTLYNPETKGRYRWYYLIIEDTHSLILHPMERRDLCLIELDNVNSDSRHPGSCGPIT